METKDDFIICPIKETDNAQMARLIRCVIDEFGVSRTSTVYDDPATYCISQSVENTNAEYWVIDYKGEIQGGCGFYPTKGLPDKCVEIVKYYLSLKISRLIILQESKSLDNNKLSNACKCQEIHLS